MRHLLIYILGIHLLACNTNSSKSVKGSTIKNQAKISDSISFDPYVLTLIEQNKFVNPDCISKNNPLFLKDSIYKEAQKHPWFLISEDWYLGQAWLFISYPSNSEQVTNDIYEFNFETKTIEYKSKYIAQINQFKSYLKIVDSVKHSIPNYEYWKDVLMDGGNNYLYYDGSKFYALSSAKHQVPEEKLENALKKIKFKIVKEN